MKRVFIGLIGIFLFNNLGVSGSCFSFCNTTKNFEHIYFTGFDATGIGHEMIKDRR